MDGERADPRREHLVAWGDERQKKAFKSRVDFVGSMTPEEARCLVQERPRGVAKAVGDASGAGEVSAGKKRENTDEYLVRDVVDGRHGQPGESRVSGSGRFELERYCEDVGVE